MPIINVTLPSDGTGADVADYNVPINTIVAAINGGLDSTNLASSAITADKIATNAVTTTKIVDSTVTLAKLNGGTTAGVLETNATGMVTVSSQTLGYSQITSSVAGTSTSLTAITGLSTTVTIPPGGKDVRVTVFARSLRYGSSNVAMSIWEGYVGIGTKISEIYTATSVSGASFPVYISRKYTASAGSITYNVGWLSSSTGQVLDAAATYPAYIMVEAA